VEGEKRGRRRILHVHSCPTVLDFRAYRGPNEEVELLLGFGISLKVVDLNVISDGLMFHFQASIGRETDMENMVKLLYGYETKRNIQ